MFRSRAARAWRGLHGRTALYCTLNVHEQAGIYGTFLPVVVVLFCSVLCSMISIRTGGRSLLLFFLLIINICRYLFLFLTYMYIYTITYIAYMYVTIYIYCYIPTLFSQHGQLGMPRRKQGRTWRHICAHVAGVAGAVLLYALLPARRACCCRCYARILLR